MLPIRCDVSVPVATFTTTLVSRATHVLANVAATALGASGLLGLLIAVNAPTSADAGVREIVSKPATATRATSTAKKTAKATTSTSRTEPKPNSKIRLIAQTESPLDRLRQRDVEQRLREAIADDSSAQPSGFIQPDQPLELPDSKNPKSLPTEKYVPEESPAPKRLSNTDSDPPPFETAPSSGSRDGKALEPLPMDDAPSEQITSPAHLKKISEIQPYFDYQPATTLKGDVCWDLCPRPDGSDCKADPETGLVPECPSEYRLSDQAYSSRAFGDCLYQWQASDMYHNPLYFEDCALERYGHTHHCLLQPFVSMGKFGVQLAGLPYQMTIDPVRKKMYNLGYYRPGECAPKKYYRIPWNTHAAVAEAAVWTGLIIAFP